MRLIALSAALGLFVACSSSTTGSPSPSPADAGTDSATADPDASSAADSSANDASDDASPPTATSVVVTLNGTTRTLTRAQFGKNADGTLHVEAHLGGDAACPTQSSPTPMYTLIVSGLPGTTLTGSFLDFQGDVLTGGTPATKATSLSATNVQTTVTTTSFDVTATFAEGTASGHLSAAHCASLDE